ncbi:MAG: hypothetical protein RR620_13165 [Clostridium sp.]
MKIVYMCPECDGTEFKELEGFIVCANNECEDNCLIKKDYIEKEHILIEQ